MDKIEAILNHLIERYPVLECSKNDICEAYTLLEKSYAKGGKLLVCGNGGSAADAEHIVGELMKGFVKKRSLPESFQEKLKDIDNEKGSV